ncbi:uncharacterized protein HD556DRAFT_1437104 [Suillus plorans]|uniref:Uncharacterized protein n=1 Tax=Suillus plorans TaxID=116603 RepID=A0A9P7J6F8_9AGAM|nr:uncharacterized protein HD556DRAFT_1437104 [Suillus plorans]KAG1804944.1 hypothetical protein HD556DRAFT_1437104 [Suillus plorans]
MNQLFTIYFVFTYFGELLAAGMVGFFAPVGFLSPFMLSITLLSFLLALLHVRLVHTVLNRSPRPQLPLVSCSNGFRISGGLNRSSLLRHNTNPAAQRIFGKSDNTSYCADRQDLGSLGDVYDFLLSWFSSCIASHTNTPETLPQTLSEPFTNHYLRFDTPMSPVSHTAGTNVLPQPYYQLSDQYHREKKSDEESCIGLHV